MNLCLNCKLETANPKFCSRSCSSSFNNRSNPRRSLQGACSGCGTSISSSRKFCQGCRAAYRSNLGDRTKAQLRAEGNANFGGNYPYIRNHSRRTYESSGRSMACHVCDYDTHIEVCHIRDVNDFPESATVREINDINNLVALCRNHHWEFDNGHIKIQL